jgi:hypothetical protein
MTNDFMINIFYVLKTNFPEKTKIKQSFNLNWIQSDVKL